MFKITSSVEFDAAHFLINTHTKCDNLHGHRWKVEVTLKSETLNKDGFIINFSILKQWLKDIVDKYDHNLLNYFLEQSTAEHLSYYIFRSLTSKLVKYNQETNMNVKVEEVKIAETPGNIASFGCYDYTEKEKDRRAIYDFWSKNDNIKSLVKSNIDNDFIINLGQKQMLREANPLKGKDVLEKMLASLKISVNNNCNEKIHNIINWLKDNDIDLQYVGDGQVVINGKIPDFINYESRVIVDLEEDEKDIDSNWYDNFNNKVERQEFFTLAGYTYYILWYDNFLEQPQKELSNLKHLL